MTAARKKNVSNWMPTATMLSKNGHEIHGRFCFVALKCQRYAAM